MTLCIEMFAAGRSEFPQSLETPGLDRMFRLTDCGGKGSGLVAVQVRGHRVTSLSGSELRIKTLPHPHPQIKSFVSVMTWLMDYARNISPMMLQKFLCVFMT